MSEKSEEKEIRLNIDDDDYYIIKIPSTFSELTDAIHESNKDLDIKKCEISMVFLKYPEMFCQDEESFKKMIGKKDEIFLEIKVRTKEEVVNPNVSVNFDKREKYDFEFLQSQKKITILKGNNKYNILVKVKNTGNSTWELPITLAYSKGEKGVVCTDFSITKKINPDEEIETNVALVELSKVEVGKHVIKLQLKIGNNPVGTPKGLEFSIVDMLN